ncbi:MAG: hypothetical protein MH204_07610 [Fimbriimonadaceae bacterium]|nr:hypothetical protein [Fimbriimonadaceae bacterium]
MRASSPGRPGLAANPWLKAVLGVLMAATGVWLLLPRPPTSMLAHAERLRDSILRGDADAIAGAVLPADLERNGLTKSEVRDIIRRRVLGPLSEWKSAPPPGGKATRAGDAKMAYLVFHLQGPNAAKGVGSIQVFNVDGVGRVPLRHLLVLGVTAASGFHDAGEFAAPNYVSLLTDRLREVVKQEGLKGLFDPSSGEFKTF